MPSIKLRPHCFPRRFWPPYIPVCMENLRIRTETSKQTATQSNTSKTMYCRICFRSVSEGKFIVRPGKEKSILSPISSTPHTTRNEDANTTIKDCINNRQNSRSQSAPSIFIIAYSLVRFRKEPMRKWKKLINPTSNINVPTIPVTHPRI